HNDGDAKKTKNKGKRTRKGVEQHHDRTQQQIQRYNHMKLGEIAAKLNCDLTGDASIEIRGVAGIENASEGDLSFLVNPKYLPQLKHTRASGLIVALDFAPSRIALLRNANPYLAFARAIELFNPPR